MAVTNSSGNAYALYTMDAFGNVLEKGNAGYLYEHTTDPQPYHLTTKEYDPDARLYYSAPGGMIPRRGDLLAEIHWGIWIGTNCAAGIPWFITIGTERRERRRTYWMIQRFVWLGIT